MILVAGLIGIVLIIVLFLMFNGKLTGKTICSIYSAAMYGVEIIMCLAKGTVKLFSNNTFFSIILLLFFPVLLLVVLALILYFVGKKK